MTIRPRVIYELYDRVWFPIWRSYARLRRATVHPSVEFYGAPLLRCARGSRMSLRAGVRIHSTPAANPLIGSVKTRLSTLCPDAVLDIGENVGMSAVCISSALHVSIGEGTIVGADALIVDTDFHLPRDGWRWGDDMAATAKPVRIGRACFIGARAIILKGVTIGDGAVIAAGAVVRIDVPTGFVAIGNPAVIRPLQKQWMRDERGNPLLHSP